MDRAPGKLAKLGKNVKKITSDVSRHKLVQFKVPKSVLNTRFISFDARVLCPQCGSRTIELGFAKPPTLISLYFRMKICYQPILVK